MLRKVGFVILAVAGTGAAQTFHPDIPRAWDDKAVARLEVPLAQRDRSPRYLTTAEYYALKVRTIYRTYPVYVAGQEPDGYFESLKQKDPEVDFDASKLHTREDWIPAGEALFEYSPAWSPALPGGAGYPAEVNVLALREGIVGRGILYVVRQKGLVERTAAPPCAGCHQRALPDGTAIAGAQSNFRFGQLDSLATGPRVLDREWLFAGAPWVLRREEFDKVVSAEEIARRKGAMQPGVFEREGTSSAHPSHIPSLIGIESIRYLDSTGLMHHRSVGDLMRYVIVNYGLQLTAQAIFNRLRRM